LSKIDKLLPSISEKYFGGIIGNDNHFHGMLIHQRKPKTFSVYFFNSKISEDDNNFYEHLYDKIAYVFQRKIRLDGDELFIFKNHCNMKMIKSTQQRDTFRCAYYAFLGKLCRVCLTLRIN
jgi:hypothetical protein